MTSSQHIQIPDTHRAVWPGATRAADLADGDVQVTAWLHPRHGGKLDVERAMSLGSTLPAQRTYVDRGELIAQTAADPNDVELLRRYCARFGIEAVATHWRAVSLTGSIHQLVKAFGADAGIYELEDKRRFRHRKDSLSAPQEIAAFLQCVLGIDEWPRSHAIGEIHPEATPPTLAETTARYAFPDADGAGASIAVVQLRGEFRPNDFAACMKRQGVTARTPIVKRLDNAELAHGTETVKDVESAIDTQIAAALAPGAQLIVYAAPDDERGVLDAIRTAIFDEEHRPSILSISFGFPEHLWTAAALKILDDLFAAAALLGVTIFCASGDNGAELDAAGVAHVLAPASSPFAHACGGTQLVRAHGDVSEVAWAKTGGGFSAHFPVPLWQNMATSIAAKYKVNPGRGLPDVAAEAMPGYCVYFNGTQFSMAGTSAVAPMWAALTARLAQRLGHPLGFFAPLLYGSSARDTFRAITSGANDRYASAVGWNPCTGLGVPIGTALESVLRGKKT